MKKIPMRKCLATQELCPKQELIRVVKNNLGEVFVDTTGRANGRGAYLKKDKEAIEKNGVMNIRIDYKASGLGSASCETEMKDEYKLNDKKIDFSFTIC